MGITSLEAPRGIPKVPSLLFDLEMDDGAKSSQSVEDMDVNLVKSELRRFLRPSSSTAVKLHGDVDHAVKEQLADTEVVDATVLARTLIGLGYNVRLRRAIGGGEGAVCLHNLRHVFLSITLPGNIDTTSFVVDPSFGEQFKIAKPTARYSSIEAVLPGVLVIPEDRIPPLVTFLCGELTLAFKATNTVLPPWRQSCSMLSKWQPRRSMDMPVVHSTLLQGSLAGPGGSSLQPMESFSETQRIHQAEMNLQSGKPTVSHVVVTSIRHISQPQISEPVRVYGGFACFGYINMASGLAS